MITSRGKHVTIIDPAGHTYDTLCVPTLLPTVQGYLAHKKMPNPLGPP